MEWVQFARVERVPRAGEIVHARDTWEEAAGGGAVAAVQLARLAGGADFFTALGDDDLGHRSAAELAERGIVVHAAWRHDAQRRAFTFTDSGAERTITVMGERQVPHGDDRLPWERLADVDAVYFTGGDAEALRAARAAGTLVATARARETLHAAPAWRSTRSCTAPTTRARAWWPARSSPRPRWWSRPTAPTAGATPAPTVPPAPTGRRRSPGARGRRLRLRRLVRRRPHVRPRPRRRRRRGAGAGGSLRGGLPHRARALRGSAGRRLRVPTGRTRPRNQSSSLPPRVRPASRDRRRRAEQGDLLPVRRGAGGVGRGADRDRPGAGRLPCYAGDLPRHDGHHGGADGGGDGHRDRHRQPARGARDGRAHVRGQRSPEAAGGRAGGWDVGRRRLVATGRRRR